MPRHGLGKTRATGRTHGTFDVNDEGRIKHTKVGVWDLYEERIAQSRFLSKLPGLETLESYAEAFRSLPYVWMMIRDIAAIKGCWMMLLVYAIVDLMLSLLPAVSLW
jgi:hypothetical protein